jgi:hypothetical protein
MDVIGPEALEGDIAPRYLPYSGMSVSRKSVFFLLGRVI